MVCYYFGERLLSSSSYTYDANGNVTSDTHRSIALIIYNPDKMQVSEYLTNPNGARGRQIIYENDMKGSRVMNSIAQLDNSSPS